MTARRRPTCQGPMASCRRATCVLARGLPWLCPSTTPHRSNPDEGGPRMTLRIPTCGALRSLESGAPGFAAEPWPRSLWQPDVAGAGSDVLHDPLWVGCDDG